MSIENGEGKSPKVISLESARARLNQIALEKEMQQFAPLLNELGATSERLFEISKKLQAEIQASIGEKRDTFPVEIAEKIGDIFASIPPHQTEASRGLADMQSALSDALTLYMNALNPRTTSNE